MRMVVVSEKETVHVFSLPKELSQQAISRIQNRDSFASIQSQNSNYNPLLESRHGGGPGFFGKLWGKEGESSYLKLYVDHKDKICAIVNKKLVIVRKDGIVHYIDIQAKGKYFDSDKDNVETVELF